VARRADLFFPRDLQKKGRGFIGILGKKSETKSLEKVGPGASHEEGKS